MSTCFVHTPFLDSTPRKNLGVEFNRDLHDRVLKFKNETCKRPRHMPTASKSDSISILEQNTNRLSSILKDKQDEIEKLQNTLNRNPNTIQIQSANNSEEIECLRQEITDLSESRKKLEAEKEDLKDKMMHYLLQCNDLSNERMEVTNNCEGFQLLAERLYEEIYALRVRGCKPNDKLPYVPFDSDHIIATLNDEQDLFSPVEDFVDMDDGEVIHHQGNSRSTIPIYGTPSRPSYRSNIVVPDQDLSTICEEEDENEEEDDDDFDLGTTSSQQHFGQSNDSLASDSIVGYDNGSSDKNELASQLNELRKENETLHDTIDDLNIRLKISLSEIEELTHRCNSAEDKAQTVENITEELQAETLTQRLEIAQLQAELDRSKLDALASAEMNTSMCEKHDELVKQNNLLQQAIQSVRESDVSVHLNKSDPATTTNDVTELTDEKTSHTHSIDQIVEDNASDSDSDPDQDILAGIQEIQRLQNELALSVAREVELTDEMARYVAREVELTNELARVRAADTETKEKQYNEINSLRKNLRETMALRDSKMEESDKMRSAINRLETKKSQLEDELASLKSSQAVLQQNLEKKTNDLLTSQHRNEELCVMLRNLAVEYKKLRNTKPDINVYNSKVVEMQLQTDQLIAEFVAMLCQLETAENKEETLQSLKNIFSSK